MNDRIKVFLDGPDAVKRIGPLIIEYYRYGGPVFWLDIGHGLELYLSPGRYSPLWLVWALVRKGMERRNDDGEMGAQRDEH
jgi:hypothetical protein